MEQVQTIVNDLVENTETVLNRGLDNVYISTTIKVLIGLYAAFAAPKLPASLVDLMDNIFVRIGFAFVIVLVATRDPSIALMIAIAFIVTLQTANKLRLFNTELSVAAPGQSSWLPSAKEKDLLTRMMKNLLMVMKKKEMKKTKKRNKKMMLKRTKKKMKKKKSISWTVNQMLRKLI